MVTETFDGADLGVLTGLAGTWTVAGGTCEVGVAGLPRAAARADVGSDDQSVEILMATVPTASYSDLGPAVRVDATAEHYYAALRGYTSGRAILSIVRYDLGVETELVRLDPAPALVAGERVRLEVVGSDLTAYLDDVETLTITDAVLASGTFAGMVGYRSATTATRDMHADTWTGVPIGAPPAGGEGAAAGSTAWAGAAAGTAPEVDAPDTPTNLRVTAHTAASVTVAWDAVAGVDDYTIQRERWVGTGAPA